MKLLLKSVKIATLFVVLLSLFAASAFGQLDTGQIAGTVTDPSGATVSNATVTVTNTDTGLSRTVTTLGNGNYTIPSLPAGAYKLAIKASGFDQFQQAVTVTVGGHSTVDAKLAVGNQSTTVEVIGSEEGTQVNTQTQELSEIITPQQVAQLPSLTRNPYDFVAIAGNVSGGDRTSSGGDQNTTGRGVGYSINGQRTSGTEVLLDGVENTDLFSATYGQQIPIDAVQEFRVITSNFDAQYGRASGGVVNLTTKAGTNNFHGSAWEFNRLSAYTANTYANDAANAAAGSIVAPKGGYTRNQFGYTIGGPIIKDKLFIFQSTEWTKVRSSSVNQAYVPTPQFLAQAPSNVGGFFSAYGATNFNFSSTLTASQVAAAVGTKAGGAFSTFAAANPTLPVAGLVNFSTPSDAGGGVPTNTYRILGRIDFNMTDKTQMFFRYALENIDNFIGGDYGSPYSQYNVGDAQYNNSGLFSFTHIFSPTLLSNTKISFSRLNIVQTYDSKVLQVPELLLTSGASINGVPVQLPGLWAQYAGAGGEPYGGPQNVLQVAPDFSWSKGTHNIRFGGIFDYEQINRSYGAYGQGLEELGTSNAAGWDGFVTGNLAVFQAAINPQGKFPCPKGSVPTAACSVTLPVTQPVFARSYRYHDWAIYLQDSWKATPRLTLNYGVRYEHYGVQHNSNQQLDSNFYYGSGSNIFQQVANGSVQIAPNSPVGGMWKPSWGTVAPRVGFAYDVLGDGKTSLRGGTGVSYERNFGNVTFNALFNPPNYQVVQLTSKTLGVPIPVTTSNFGPFGGSSGTVPLSPGSLRHISQNIKTAQTLFWSAALEHEVARRTVVALEYAGARGIHLYDISAYNAAGGAQEYLGVPFTGTYLRPNLQYSGINTRGSNGTNSYNAMNVRFQSTNLHNTGVSVVANYTWAHSLDDLSSTFSDSTGGGSNGIGNLGYLNPTDPKLDWGSSDYDIRHRVSVSTIWETPWMKSGRGLKRQVLGGYTVVPMFSARTGTPFSVFDTTNSANAGGGYGIPRYTPSGAISSYHTGSAVAVGPNNFTVLTLPEADLTPFDPVLGISDFGPYPANMTRRNAFRGPGAWNFDLAVSKSFPLTERVNLEFRAEGFDILNHHNLYINALNLDAFNYGNDPNNANLSGAITVPALKGGLGGNAIGGNHDERRFGQFALRVSF